MPRPVQSPAADLVAASPRSSATAQSAALGTSRPQARDVTLLPSPRFREALHEASRKPEPRPPAGEKSPAERSATGTSKKTSSASKAGRPRRATKHAGKREDHDDDDTTANKRVTDGDPRLPDGVAAEGGLAQGETNSDGIAKSDGADEQHSRDAAANAAQPLAPSAASARSNGKTKAADGNSGAASTRRRAVVQAVTAKSGGSDSPDVNETDAADGTESASTDETGDEGAEAADPATAHADVAKPDPTAAGARATGPKLGAALAGRPDNDLSGGAAAGIYSDAASASSSAGQPGAAPAAGVSDAIAQLSDAAFPEPPDAASAKPVSRVTLDPADPSLAQPADGAPSKSAGNERTAAVPPPPAPEAPPEARFAEVNHAKIVTGIHGELLPNGGAMHLRLDPPELGDLLVSVQMRDGVMTAAFQTSNDEATRLLSHSLGDLKATLEAQGVTVERLHVQQAPRQEQDAGPGHRDGSRNPAAEDQNHARREQQRREMVQRLWDKLAGRDAVDLTA
jgi:flagellar hook-length control protein FliK